MTFVLFALAVVLALLLAYMVQFTGATLTMGRELDGSGSKTGFQDAITPPWQTNLALVTYAAVPGAISLAWWFRGLLVALLVLAVIVVAAFGFRLFLPKATSTHFRVLILRSMSRRYADFVQKGDSVRAEAMQMLLRRAGIDPAAVRDS